MNTRFWIPLAFFLSLVTTIGSAQPAGFSLEGIGSQQVPICLNKITNLVFPVEILKGVKVSRDIIAQKVSGVENVIELKAARRNFTPTNLTVYGRDSRIYSFELRYDEDPQVLNFRIAVGGDSTGGQIGHLIRIAGLPTDKTTLSADAGALSARHGFLHVRAGSEGVKLRLQGLYLKDSLLWMVFRLSNHSRVGYSPARYRFFAEDRKKIKRTASQELSIDPVYAGSGLSVAGHGSAVFAVGFAPFLLPRDKRMVVHIGEPGGGRELLMRVKAKFLLKTRLTNNK